MPKLSVIDLAMPKAVPDIDELAVRAAAAFEELKRETLAAA